MNRCFVLRVLGAVFLALVFSASVVRAQDREVQRVPTDSLISPTVVDPRTTAEQKPVVSITASSPQLFEADLRGAYFAVSRIGPVDLTSLTVQYSVSGTATSGRDYAALSGSVTIPRGSSSAKIVINPLPDSVREGNETIIVTLRSTASSPYVLGTTASATVTLLDYHSVVTIRATDATASEGTSRNPGVFTIYRAGSTASSLTVNYAVSGTATSRSDYSALPTAVTIPAGSTSASITITPVNDTTAEATETVIVQLRPGQSYELGTPNQAQVTIADAASTQVTVSGITIQPTSVQGGQQAVATISLSGNAPSQGFTVPLTTNDIQGRIVVVPSMVTVPGGKRSVRVGITTRPIAQDVSVSVAAGSGRGAKAGTLIVTAPPRLASLVISPTSVEVGGFATATIRLTRPTAVGSGGFLVRLTAAVSGTAGVIGITMPSQVLVLEQQDSKSFTITTSLIGSMTSDIAVNIQARYGTTQSVTAALAVRASLPPQVGSLTVSPFRVVGGNSLTGRVSLTGPAPPRGLTLPISISSKVAYVSPGGSVTVPAGADNAAFTITTRSVTATTAVTITAGYRGAAKSAAFTVLPPQPELESVTLSPSSVEVGGSVTGTVKLTKAVPEGSPAFEVNLSSSCGCSAVRLNISTYQGRLRIGAGRDSGTFQVSTSLYSGASMRYNAQATIRARHGTDQYKSGSFTVLAPPRPPELESVTLSPSSVEVGGSVTGTVKLTKAVPEGSPAFEVNLRKGTCGLQCNGRVRVNISLYQGRLRIGAGRDSGTFQVTTSLESGASMTNNSRTQIIARHGADQYKSASLTVQPLPVQVSSVSASRDEVIGGQSVNITVELNTAPATGSVTVSLTSSDSENAPVAPTLEIANQSSGTLRIATVGKTVQKGYRIPVTVTAILGNSKASTQFTIWYPTISELIHIQSKAQKAAHDAAKKAIKNMK